MMTMMLRVVLIVVSVITMTFMMRKIRQAKVQIEARMSGDHGADLSSICSGSRSCGSLRKVVRHLFHTKLSVPVYDLLLIVKAFGMTIQLSQLESKQRELIQKMALEQKFLEEKEAELEEREAALETCGKGE